MSFIRHQFNYLESLEWFSRRLANTNIVEAFKIPRPSRDQINKDISRTCFFGDKISSLNFFFDGWQKNKDFCFAQGDMDGGMYTQYLWSHVFLTENVFIDDESRNPLRIKNFTDLRCGYISDKNERAGICLRFLNYDPKCWILCIMKNSNKDDLAERKVIFFYSKFFSPPTSSHHETTAMVLADQKISLNHGISQENFILQSLESNVLSKKLSGFLKRGAIQSEVIDQCQHSLLIGSLYFDSWLVKFQEATKPDEMIVAIDNLLEELDRKKIPLKLIKNYFDKIFIERSDFIMNNIGILLINAEVLNSYWIANKQKQAGPLRKQACAVLLEALTVKRDELFQDVTKIRSKDQTLTRMANEEKRESECSTPPTPAPRSEIPIIAAGIFGGCLGLGLGFLVGILLSPLLGVSIVIAPVIGALIGTFIGGQLAKQMLESRPMLVQSPQPLCSEEKKASTMIYANRLTIPKEALIHGIRPAEKQELRLKHSPVVALYPENNKKEQVEETQRTLRH